MNVFISSVIGGLGEFRDVVDNATTTLGHNAIRAEDFNASPQSPDSLACRKFAILTRLCSLSENSTAIFNNQVCPPLMKNTGKHAIHICRSL